MANNEHINKVVKSTGETLIDLTGDTVTAGTLLKDVTAHDRSGAAIVGEAVIPTVNDGTLTIQQNGTTKATFTANQEGNTIANLTDTTYSAGDTMTLNNTTFDIGKRWTAVSEGRTWSRLFYSERIYESIGSCGVLTIASTRFNVVINASFLIIASTSSNINQSVRIIQISGASFSSVRVRAVSRGYGRYYFEVYDAAFNIAVGTKQTWNCRYMPLLESTITPYTSFTDGTTIPTSWMAVNEFTTDMGSNVVAIKNITRSGNTFTATRQDGSTFTFSGVDFGTTAGTACEGNDSRVVNALQTSGGTMTGALEWGDGVGGIAYVPSTYDLQIYNQLADYGRITVSSGGKLELKGHNEVKLQISGGNFVMGEHLFYMNLPDESSENLQIHRMTYGGGSELVIDGSGYVGKSSSSREIKHNIQYIEDTESYHDALMRIKPATYVYNNDKSETAKLGMIAEDIADVMPIAALTAEGGKVENYDTRAIIAMLVMEVQRLNAEIERLRGDSNAD